MESSFFTCVSGKGARHSVHPLDTLATDNLDTLEEHMTPARWKHEVSKRKVHSAPRHDKTRAHTLGFGCLDVSQIPKQQRHQKTRDHQKVPVISAMLVQLHSV